jgi:type II secretory pathway pseudopilin PulG
VKDWKVALVILAVVLFVITGALIAQQAVSQGPQATSVAAWSFSLNQLNTVALGNPTAWGTAPTGNVIGVNANVLSNVPVSPQTTSTYAFTSDLHNTSSTTTFSTVKGSAGNLYGGVISNSGSVGCYVVFYNSTAPTIGTTSIVDRWFVQAGVTVPIMPGSIALQNYSTGITLAATTTVGGTTLCGGSGSPTGSIAVDLNIYAQ